MRIHNSDLEACWRERVDAWRSTGVTGAQFAAQNGFSTSALTGWSSKLRHRPAPRPSAPAFVAVVGKDAAPIRELAGEVAGARDAWRRPSATRDRRARDPRCVVIFDLRVRDVRSPFTT